MKNGYFEFLAHFVDLTDPRKERGRNHNLLDMVALAFAAEGASVVVADVSEPGNNETARPIEEQGGKVLAVRCDVTRAKDVQIALNKTIETFGRLDFAFNNAGADISLKT